MAKKPVLPSAFPDIHVEPIQVSTVIVIHPGSTYLRIGRASDAFPHVVPHCIARRNLSGPYPIHRDRLLVPLIKMSPELSATMDEIQRAICAVLASCVNGDDRIRYSTPQQNIAEHNVNAKPNVIKPHSDITWTKVNELRNFVVGEEALHLNPSENYNIHWPIRRGQFNIHSGVGGSVTSVLDDLEAIWSTVIQQFFDVSSNDLKMYRAVLVIPDTHNRNHVKMLVHLLLSRLGFSSCFVHLESVCATFGAGLSYACVVDVGDQKTSVSCVEDGISHRSSRLSMEYGGSDITRLFHWLQLKCQFPYKFSDESMLDQLLLQELKETLCHVNLDICGIQDRAFVVKRPGMPTFRYNIKVGDDCLVAPLALFHPELFGMTGLKRVHTQQRSNGDADDPNDEQYLIQTQRRCTRDTSDGHNAEQVLAEDNHLNSSIIDEDMDSTDPPTAINREELGQDLGLSCEQLLGIDQAILQSIECCDNEELKKKMYSCILIVGGGMLFSNIHTWLHNRLAVHIPEMFRGEPIEIITRPKDMDPRITTWKGAAIMSSLDTAQELWISQKDWAKYSVKLLRERAPFTW